MAKMIWVYMWPVNSCTWCPAHIQCSQLSPLNQLTWWQWGLCWFLRRWMQAIRHKKSGHRGETESKQTLQALCSSRAPWTRARELLRVDFPTFNFWSYLIRLSYLISDHSGVWYYVRYYKVQGHTQYTCLTHGQCMHHCTLRRSTADTCI